MKTLCVLAAALACISINANATPVLIGEIFHDYGSASGQLDPGGNDPLSADYVTVKDSSTSRFYDAFDFSAFNFTSIDYFQVTLDFTQTNGTFESWRARPGASTYEPALNKVGDVLTSQTFTFGPGVDTFSSAVAAKNFNLWFAEEGIGANDFRLFDAKLSVFGEAAAVPEPSSLALAGLGVIALAGLRRSRKI